MSILLTFRNIENQKCNAVPYSDQMHLRHLIRLKFAYEMYFQKMDALEKQFDNAE